jgi:hypothetical protein
MLILAAFPVFYLLLTVVVLHFSLSAGLGMLGFAVLVAGTFAARFAQ